MVCYNNGNNNTNRNRFIIRGTEKEKETNPLFAAKCGVGRKSRTFRECPHLLCKKDSLRNPETSMDADFFRQSTSQPSLPPIFSKEERGGGRERLFWF